MKKIIMLIVVGTMLTGCAGTGLFSSTMFDKMESCGECLSGLQELGNLQGIIPAIKELETDKE